jgi:hypothetical protein
MNELISGKIALGLASALSLAFAASVFAQNVTSVESILNYPDSFNREIVVLQGTAKGVVQNLGREGAGSQVCIQDFGLDDGTGTLPVRYIALCQTGDAKVVEVHEGDQVVVTATMNVPADNIESATGQKPSLRAMATKITKPNQ